MNFIINTQQKDMRWEKHTIAQQTIDPESDQSFGSVLLLLLLVRSISGHAFLRLRIAYYYEGHGCATHRHKNRNRPARRIRENPEFARRYLFFG